MSTKKETENGWIERLAFRMFQAHVKEIGEVISEEQMNSDWAKTDSEHYRYWNSIAKSVISDIQTFEEWTIREELFHVSVGRALYDELLKYIEQRGIKIASAKKKAE